MGNCLIHQDFEQKLKKAKELKEKLDNFGPDMLHSEYLELEKEYKLILNESWLYRSAKEAVKFGFQFVAREDDKTIGYIKGWSQAGHPEVCYAERSCFSLPVTTYRGVPFVELNPEEFMRKIVEGDFAVLGEICPRCGKKSPAKEKHCIRCGARL